MELGESLGTSAIHLRLHQGKTRAGRNPLGTQFGNQRHRLGIGDLEDVAAHQSGQKEVLAETESVNSPQPGELETVTVLQ